MSNSKITIHGAFLNPLPNGSVELLRDTFITAENGNIRTISQGKPGDEAPVLEYSGILIPPFFDIHTHISQYRIRGRFTDGIKDTHMGEALLHGLQKNVFPEEARFSDRDYASQVIREFYNAAISQGVIGGAAYLTIHPNAVDIALNIMPSLWTVGLVLMNTNCPESLRTNTDSLEEDLERLYQQHGSRFSIADRFAVAVDSNLREIGASFAQKHSLLIQTHLNEQLSEKWVVERQMYPECANYTDVYRRDGLLNNRVILAHCIHMSESEWTIISPSLGRSGLGVGAHAIAHCPVSNTLLGSGRINIQQINNHGIPYAIATDVGASPTCSMLNEMSVFIKMHQGRVSASEALYRATLAPAHILGHADRYGSFEVGKSLSFIEIDGHIKDNDARSIDDIICEELLNIDNNSLYLHADRWELLGTGSRADIQPLVTDILHHYSKLEGKIKRVVVDSRPVYTVQT